MSSIEFIQYYFIPYLQIRQFVGSASIVHLMLCQGCGPPHAEGPLQTKLPTQGLHCSHSSMDHASAANVLLLLRVQPAQNAKYIEV